MFRKGRHTTRYKSLWKRSSLAFHATSSKILTAEEVSQRKCCPYVVPRGMHALPSVGSGWLLWSKTTTTTTGPRRVEQRQGHASKEHRQSLEHGSRQTRLLIRRVRGKRTVDKTGADTTMVPVRCDFTLARTRIVYCQWPQRSTGSLLTLRHLCRWVGY